MNDPILLNLFSEALQMSGYNVSSFTDPRLAYQHIKANSTEYSLIIINDKMPKINALLLIQTLRNKSKTKCNTIK